MDVLTPLVDEGLGNTAYLLDLGDGRALAVDPSLDLRAVNRAAHSRGLTIVYAAETHLHADFLSGARQLAKDHGAQILASATGDRTFEHVRLGDGDEVDLGGLTLRTLATPGHTPEHVSFAVLDGSREIGVFTGGSLIVGAAARTDLVSPELTEPLARAQYQSLRRLTELPDDTKVWPTHGAGSFCSAPPGSARTSTIGTEKLGNYLLNAPDEDTFVRLLRESLGSYPAYFGRLGEVNRHGPLITAAPALPALDQGRVRTLLADGAMVVDVRAVADYASGHLGGSVAIPLRASFATWLGWLVPPNVPIIIVRNADQDPADILWPALNIGYHSIVGELAGGVSAWPGELRTTRLIGPSEVDTPVVVDVRQASEHATGHLPRAHLIELGSLAEHTDDLPPGPATTMCEHGERSTTAASILERAGRTDLSVLIGSAREWAKATGHALQPPR